MDPLPLLGLPHSPTSWAALVGLALWLADLAIKVAALGVIPRNRKPSAAMAWLILILVVPFAGFAVFLVLGRASVGAARARRQEEADRVIREASDALAATAAPAADHPPYLRSLATLGRTLGALPLEPGNRVRLIPGYDDALAAQTRAVEEATATVEVEYYIASWDAATTPFFEALAAAVQRGVTVRLLFDHMGSRSIPGYRDLIRRLEAAGIDGHPMLPIHPLRGQVRRPDLRNHRKIVVVDGHVAFTGSQNLVEPGYNKPANHRAGREWVELVARVEGPAVNALRAVFAADWYSETGARIGGEITPATVTDHSDEPDAVTAQVLPSGPGYPHENNLLVFTSLIHAAQHRLSITSPYFVPDEPLLYAVTTAAQRGVAVELFVSEEADQFMVHHAQCSYYEQLLAAGVRIHLYPAPAVLHSKHFSVDDDVAVIGSSNMDMRSFALNYEVSTVLTGGEVVARFREVEDTYRALSRELTAQEWAGRRRLPRYVDNAMRLTAALQ